MITLYSICNPASSKPLALLPFSSVYQKPRRTKEESKLRITEVNITKKARNNKSSNSLISVGKFGEPAGIFCKTVLGLITLRKIIVGTRQ